MLAVALSLSTKIMQFVQYLWLEVCVEKYLSHLKTNRKCYRPSENLSVENSICREEVEEETVVHMTTLAGSLFHSGIVVHREEDMCRAVLDTIMTS